MQDRVEKVVSLGVIYVPPAQEKSNLTHLEIIEAIDAAIGSNDKIKYIGKLAVQIADKSKKSATLKKSTSPAKDGEVYEDRVFVITKQKIFVFKTGGKVSYQFTHCRWSMNFTFWNSNK